MSVKPITPDEVAATRARSLPPEVIEVFNQLIVENWNGASSRVFEPSAIVRIAEKMGIKQKDVKPAGYTRVEKVFEDAGWTVVYDRPDWDDEQFPATYLFTPRSN